MCHLIAVCELVPLMGASPVPVELPSRQLYKLMHKMIEYYVSCMMSPVSKKHSEALSFYGLKTSNLFLKFQAYS